MFHFNETNVKSSDSTVNDFMQNLSISSFLKKEKILNSGFKNSSTNLLNLFPWLKK